MKQVNYINVNLNGQGSVNFNFNVFSSTSEKSEQDFEGEKEGTSIDPQSEYEKNKKELEFTLAEEFEENINDLREKYLPSKLMTLKLNKVYMYLGNYARAVNAYSCSTYLEFELARNMTIDKKKLRRINSCKLRLCPYCAWRRSLRIFSNIRKCYDYILGHDSSWNDFKSRFLFLTLTTRNCTLSELKNEVNLLLNGFNILKRYKAFKNAFLGFVRSLEVVIDRERYITSQMYFRKKEYYDKLGLKINDENENYLKCNVHIHVLLHTTYEQYQKNYLSQEQITEFWKKACNLDYTPIVFIRSFKAKNKKEKGRELAELAKYTVKFNDYLKADYEGYKDSLDDEFILDTQVIAHLDDALFSRRLFAFGGTFRDAHKILKLDDEKMIDDSEAEEVEKIILKYYFNFAGKKYERILES